MGFGSFRAQRRELACGVPVDPTKELIMHGKEESGCERVASSVAVFVREGEVKQACVCVCVTHVLSVTGPGLF